MEVDAVFAGAVMTKLIAGYDIWMAFVLKLPVVVVTTGEEGTIVTDEGTNVPAAEDAKEEEGVIVVIGAATERDCAENDS